ncbi:hypothetical protein Y032_0634g912 [Ancylostoma ceylanicum]|uniref:Alpha-ketoglutarate-dependent dioxygenase AlkB-like domain-containing protein n=1 Tax=Ancylostoma ceylanicum TaxID=53326 RepID=A0A016WLT7_9BILA|nr:hypothetical protein Y032_0634g912 [Ancylostoma ceylanicum]
MHPRENAAAAKKARTVRRTARAVTFRKVISNVHHKSQNQPLEYRKTHIKTETVEKSTRNTGKGTFHTLHFKCRQVHFRIFNRFIVHFRSGMAAAVESPPQSCACKGVRFCALCETSERVQRLRIEEDRYAKYKVFVFDHTTGKAFHCPSLNSTSSIEEIQSATNSCSSSTQNDDVIDINGLMVVHDFLSESEEADIIEMIDGVEWVLSQSGRRKQDYGPKVNFKHKKVKTDTFVGMPEYADMLLEKMRSVSQEKLGNYVPFEMCNLEYDESKKSAIEMHFDDTWIWGNRLISINLLSGSVMTLANEKTQQLCYAWFPRRSLLCMADDARYGTLFVVLVQ